MTMLETGFYELGFLKFSVISAIKDCSERVARPTSILPPFLTSCAEMTSTAAAETTLAANATHFEILSTTDKTEQMPVYASGVFMTMEKPGVEMIVKTHAAPGAPNAQDARRIVQMLGPKLKRKS
ncbi:MAG: hypothetical protein EOR81_10855 [Mesorhizobium sp.]|nr:MAG: hypothetical protein EOR81_10855 [Mesorhizobium sp.]